MPDARGNMTTDELLVGWREYHAHEAAHPRPEPPRPLCGPSCPWPPTTPEQRRASLAHARKSRDEAIAFFRKRLNGEVSWDVPPRNPAFQGICRWI